MISEKPPIKSGFSRVICRLTEELTKMGYEVDILSAQDCNLKVVGEIKLIIGLGKVGKYMNDSYDIIHIHGHTPTFSDRLLLRSRLSGNKVIYTLHCMVDYYFKPIAMLYNNIFNKVMLKLADAVIVTSKSYYDALHISRKYLVPWGVDRDKFRGKRIPHDDFRLLFVGQMRPYKGIKVLLQAIKGLNTELSIVGDGPDRPKYERYAQKLGLDNVRFHGALTDDALRRKYLGSDVLVLPSVSMNEAFGLVTLEAAAAGCAVVASDLPGLRDVVREFGFLVRPKDPQSLRNAILMLEDKSTRRGYISKGMSAVEKYSWRRVAEDYVEIYEKILS